MPIAYAPVYSLTSWPAAFGASLTNAKSRGEKWGALGFPHACVVYDFLPLKIPYGLELPYSRGVNWNLWFQAPVSPSRTQCPAVTSSAFDTTVAVQVAALPFGFTNRRRPTAGNALDDRP